MKLKNAGNMFNMLSALAFLLYQYTNMKSQLTATVSYAKYILMKGQS